MRSLKDKITGPSQGWQWHDASGFLVGGKRFTNWNVFLDLIYKRKQVNGDFLGTNWQEQFEDDLCAQGGYDCKDSEKRERRITLDDVRHFGNVVSNHLASGGELVSQETAGTRAAICKDCPLNRPIEGLCGGCKTAELVSWLYRLSRGRSTPHDNALHGCQVCGCQNALSVWIPLSVQRDNRFTASDFAAGCWKKEAYV